MSEPWKPLWKDSRAKRQHARRRDKGKLARKARATKTTSKKRDGYRCRFPLCGCRRAGIKLESAHVVHVGMGGDPKGIRTPLEELVTLCRDRHQDSAWSLHRRTIRVKYLTSRKCNGPIAWEVDMGSRWVEVARESAIGVLEPLTETQRQFLGYLAEMAS